MGGSTHDRGPRATAMGAARLQPAGPDETAEGARLLVQEGLPTEGWGDDATLRMVLLDGGTVAGTVGLEVHGGHALLRSLAVAPGARGRGHASALVDAALRNARDAGVTEVHALTTTIPGLLERWGFAEVARDELPAALHASAELRGACPASARAFVVRVERTGGPAPSLRPESVRRA